MAKSCVVTGGTKGIGRAILERFAGEGFDLFTCARNENDLQALQQELQNSYGVALEYKPADLSVDQDRKKVAQWLTDLPEVDVLVNNTGVFIPGQIHNEQDGVLHSMISTNLYSAYDITRAVVGGMMARKSGHIFTIGSTASITPYVNGGSYCISKYALYGMTKVLREEMKEYGVRVTSVLPGATLTASWEGAEIPPERFMKPEDVAEAVYSAYSLSPQSVVEEILIRPQLGDIQ